jgi:dTDP-4-amino-4,6-dideoxygalactose transaminase
METILQNDFELVPTLASSLQRFVSKDAHAEKSFRSDLQARIAEFLDVVTSETTITCMSSGTNALRAALKVVFEDQRTPLQNEIIMPAVTAVSTAEAIIMEGFVPVLVDVDQHTWTISPDAAAVAIGEKTAAIVTVDWLGATCDLTPFRAMASKHGLKLISDSAQSFGAARA